MDRKLPIFAGKSSQDSVRVHTIPTRRLVVVSVNSDLKRGRIPSGAASSGDEAKPDRLAIFNGKRLSDIMKVLDHQYGGKTDDGAVIEIIANLLSTMKGWPDNFTRWAARRSPAMSPPALKALIDQVTEWPTEFDSSRAGRVLKISEVTRIRLRVTHIRPFDLSDSEIVKSRKENKRMRDRERREARGARPHAVSVEKQKPWLAERVSRATYFRRKRNEAVQVRETDSRSIYIDNTNIWRETVSKRNGSGAHQARATDSLRRELLKRCAAVLLSEPRTVH